MCHKFYSIFYFARSTILKLWQRLKVIKKSLLEQKYVRILFSNDLPYFKLSRSLPQNLCVDFETYLYLNFNLCDKIESAELKDVIELFHSNKSPSKYNIHHLINNTCINLDFNFAKQLKIEI